MASNRKRSKTIHSEAREMINHVNSQCKQAAEKSLILPICRADEKTANCCGVSVSTVKQVRRESRERNEGSPLHTPGKNRPRKTQCNVIIDDFDLCVVKRTVIDCYVKNEVVPTCKKLLPVIRK
jgi:hypothetical protein